jgi:hypothetical protein
MSLDSSESQTLVNLIRDSFRVRENHTPVYVEVGNNITRLSGKQHQVIFGRRGSGKSCLLVHFAAECKKSRTDHAIYIGIDEIKRLPFPDILTRLLLSLFEQLLERKRSWWQFWKKKSPVETAINELRQLLDAPIKSNVEKLDKQGAEESAEFSSRGGVGIKVGGKQSRSTDTKEQYQREKLDQLLRHLQDYKSALKSALATANRKNLFILVDDFYLIKREIQPDVVDYLHQLTRGTSAYLKIGTIRHRTSLRKHEGQTIGVELGQDVEEISLDQTLENLRATQDFLVAMLDELGKKVGIDNASGSFFNPDASHALTLASGGVPRDFLNIFVDAVDLSCKKGKTDRLTPTNIYKAAAQSSLPNKRKNLSEDAGVDAKSLENTFADIISFALKEKKRTAFLVSHENAQKAATSNELLQQLMDFKLIHLIDANTSAASGRSGRFSAYTLDVTLFMEPRLRGIEQVEFWRLDEQRRPVGVRECPTYALERVAKVQDTDLDTLMNDLKTQHEASEPEVATLD